MIGSVNGGSASASGLIPQIIVSAETGSTVSCDGVQGQEVSGTWTFNVEIGTHTITAIISGSTYTETVIVSAVKQYFVEIEDYFTEAELLAMGCQISRTVGDKIQCNGRYIKRVASNPLVVIRSVGNSAYVGYGIISNAEITESFTTSSYGSVKSLTPAGLTDAYVKTMGSMWGGLGFVVYLNSSAVTFEITETDGALTSDVAILNKIGRSIQYL